MEVNGNRWKRIIGDGRICDENEGVRSRWDSEWTDRDEGRDGREGWRGVLT